jgi:cytochrome c-type biogenesis protein CcmH/NrfF
MASDISAQVMSPFCPGVTLHDCPSASAAELRSKIAEWIDDGSSRAQVMARLKSEYGQAIAAAPAKSGRGLFAWLLPLGAIIAGGLIAWIVVKRWAAPVPSGHVPPTSEQRASIDNELRKMREA